MASFTSKVRKLTLNLKSTVQRNPRAHSIAITDIFFISIFLELLIITSKIKTLRQNLRVKIAKCKQRIFSHPDFNRRLRNFTESCQKACGLYHRWGISPRPEDINIIQLNICIVNIYLLFFKTKNHIYITNTPSHIEPQKSAVLKTQRYSFVSYG